LSFSRVIESTPTSSEENRMIRLGIMGLQLEALIRPVMNLKDVIHI